jgi:hypothetical protein
MNILQREFEDLRSQRVRLRKAIEHYTTRANLEPQSRYGVDGHLNSIVGLQAQLRGTEKRWAELHALLGKRLPGPPVRLDAPVRRYGSATRSPGAYVTKVITPR